ncbi:MAG: DUF3696 domain-containing protein [Chloroflexi bacterium]|nr:DUF3696 domain-containing protein [Chloroflexota bacterium]
MLRKIGLKNFKCWQALDIDLAPITLFFGSNSSGKTAILQSLLMLKQTARGFDPDQHINFGGSDRDYVDLGSYQKLVLGHQIDTNIGLTLQWDPASGIDWQTHVEGIARPVLRRRIGSSMFIEYAINWRLLDNIRIENLSYRALPSGTGAENVRVEIIERGMYAATIRKDVDDTYPFEQEEPVGTPESCYILPTEIVTDYPIDVRRFASFYAREFEELMDLVLYLGPVRQRPERHYLWTGNEPNLIEPSGSNTIEMLISSARSDCALLAAVQEKLKLLALVDSFDVKSIDQNERRYEATATIGGVESSLADAGFGVSQALPVITMLLSAPEGSIVLLEQPELHLHPNAQSALADLLLYAAEQRGLQLIVESHSEHILRRLQRRVAEDNPVFANPENIKMYFCQTGEAGSSISEVEIDRFGQIANWPDNFLGDISGDLHEMLRAALERRGKELEHVGHRG